MTIRAIATALLLGAAGCGGGGTVHGGPCQEHADCESDLCLSGVCAQPCADEDECEGQSCGLLAIERDGVTGLEGVCVERGAGTGLLGHRCADDAECLTGLCEDGGCTELCTECGPGAACQTATVERQSYQAEVGLCRWDAALPDLELGPVEVDTSGSPEISFDIPDGLASFTIVLRHDYPSFDQRVGFISLYAPDDTLLFDYDDEIQDLNQGSIRYPGASSVLVPATDDPAAAPLPGTYRLRVGIFETDFQTFTPVAGVIDRVSVVFERRGQEGGLMDVELHFAPATGLSAADAPESSYVANVLAEIESYYQPSGMLRLGEVGYGDLPASYNNVSDSDQVREICADYSIPGRHRTAVNLFLVDSIDFASGYTGGTPAPPGWFGTPASGVVVEMMGNASETGRVLAHELGHFLALKHTTRLNQTDAGWEVAGDDGITDTPSCSSGTAVEDCPDYRNLMFPLFPLSGELSLSESQFSVIGGNPVLYQLDVGDRVCPGTPTYDVTELGFAAGDSSGLADRDGGSCGGAGAPDRLQVYRLVDDGATGLEVSVRGQGFAPLVHIRYGDCADDAAEVACAAGDSDTDVVTTVDDPAPGYYFIAVDGRDGEGGRFTLEVSEVQ